MTFFESETLWWMKLEIFLQFFLALLTVAALGCSIWAVLLSKKAMEKQFDPELNISWEFTYEEAEPKIEVVAINSGLIPVKIIMGEVEFRDSKEPEKMMTREENSILWDFSQLLLEAVLDQNRKYIAPAEEFIFSFDSDEETTQYIIESPNKIEFRCKLLDHKGLEHYSTFISMKHLLPFRYKKKDEDISRRDDKMVKEFSHFYNNQYDRIKGLLVVDRIYLIDTENFTQEMWEELTKIYLGLPSYLESESWFGVRGENEHYLSASIEPVGLQVGGKLLEKDFLLWEEIFHKEIQKLPFLESPH